MAEKHQLAKLVVIVTILCCFMGKCVARLEMTSGGYIMNDNSPQTDEGHNQGEIVIHGIDSPPSGNDAVQNSQQVQVQTLPQGSSANLGRLQVLQNNFARRIGISTLMMGGLFYGLTLLPALAAAVGSGGGLGGLLPSLLGKRSLPDNASTQVILPLLTAQESVHLMAVLDGTFHAKKITGTNCRQFHVCDVYRKAATSPANPSLQEIEEHLLKTFGILVERKYQSSPNNLQNGVFYFDAARNGIDKLDCAALYPCVSNFSYKSPSSELRNSTHHSHRPS